MLLTNQQLDKFAASCADFEACGMLKGGLETLGESATFGFYTFNLINGFSANIRPLGPLTAAFANAAAAAENNGGNNNNNNDHNNNNDDDDDGIVSSPRVLAHVELAKTILSKYPS